MTIAPWLNVNPFDFIRASEAGAQIGLRARSLTQDANQFNAQIRSRGNNQPQARLVGFGNVDPFEAAKANALNQQVQAEKDRLAKKDYASQLYGAMRGRLGEDEAMAQSGLGALLTEDELAARANLARAKAADAPENPWQTFSLGNGELGRVNKNTGEYGEIKPARDPFQQNVFDTITERETFPAVPAQEATEAVTEKVGGFPIFHWGGRTVTNSPAMPAIPAVPAKTTTTTRKIPRNSALPWDAISAPATNAPAAQEIIRVTKDGRRAIFDAETREFLRYAPD